VTNRRRASVASTAEAKPHPPGDYPVVVVGSGPGGLQAAYVLKHLGIDHAVISADPSPGGMFRRFPFFQRLLSWTKPHAPYPQKTREYEWYDWNSLLAVEPENRSLMPPLMDGTSEFPSRPEMEAGLSAFAGQAGIRIRHDTRWEATSRDGDRFIVHTADGDYRAKVVIFAVGVAQPWTPSTPGVEHVAHYVDTREASSYRGKRLFIIGKQNSGFELASGLLHWASRIILASPRPATLSVNLHSLAGVRARYVQPWEDSNLGGGCFILNASIERIERHEDGITVHTRRSDNGEPFMAEVDEVIAATGFQAPLGDLTELGVTVFGQSRLPAMTNFYESATVPGMYFAGTIGQGVAGLKKFGIPANSGAVHGARYNTRLMAEHVAETHFGWVRERPVIRHEDAADFLLTEATTAPELWNQKSYLARAISRGSGGTLHDEGIVSLADFVDSGGPDAIAITIETDDTGDIHPAVYVRRRGRVDGDARLDGSPLHEYRTTAHRRELLSLARGVIRGS
jgi:thioredoxin reductase